MCSFGRRVCAAPRPSDMRTTITSRRQGRAARLIVALAIAATSVGTDAAIPSAESPPRQAAPGPVDAAPYAAFVAEAARRFGLPEAWIWAIIRTESHGDPYAVSPSGARGLMRLRPGDRKGGGWGKRGV